jgi:hypothetical protein
MLSTIKSISAAIKPIDRNDLSLLLNSAEG